MPINKRNKGVREYHSLTGNIHYPTGPVSYKEHGYRMLLIWLYGLPSESNPIKELCEGLVAINKKTVADALKKKAEKEIEENPKESDQSCASCIIA